MSILGVVDIVVRFYCSVRGMPKMLGYVPGPVSNVVGVGVGTAGTPYLYPAPSW